MSGFRITSGRGFHITFENGWTVSVQFGPGNYCENRRMQVGEDDARAGKQGSMDAETAVWGPDGEMVTREGDGDTVRGWQSPERVLELLTWASQQPALVASEAK